MYLKISKGASKAEIYEDYEQKINESNRGGDYKNICGDKSWK